MGKRIVFLILILFIFKGCTKDDICPEDTATTAKVVISFNDFANPTNTKNVNVLSVETDYNPSVSVVSFQNVKEIAIPLSTTSDTTKYKFIRSIIRTNDTLTNVDRLMFVYQRQNMYVSRACGYKMEYYNLSVKLEDEGAENWIKLATVIRETVNDENSAHVTMLH